MNFLPIASLARGIQTTMVRHSPEILTGIGIAGMIGSTVMAIKATPKAARLLEEAEREKAEPLTKAEVVKATWKCYIPTIVATVTSAACLIGSNSVSARRNAALATAYNLSQTALSEYKDKVIETFGEKKEEIVREAIAKDKVEKNPVSNHEVIVTGKETSLCLDGVFGRYFLSDVDTIKRAINWVNREITTSMYVSLNEFYHQLGLKSIGIGDELGWNLDDGEIDFYTSTQMAEDGRPCIVIEYNAAPKYNFNKFI